MNVSAERLRRFVESGMTYDDRKTAVSDAINAAIQTADAAEDVAAGEDPDADACDIGAWVLDMDDEFAWYEQYGSVCGTFQVAYSIDDSGKVTLGTPVAAVRKTSYETITEARHRISGRVLESKGTDAAGGRVYDVQIIEYGDSKNARRYPEAVMRTAAPIYEGAKAYDHHRTDAELATSTIAGLVGTYTNVTADARGLQAELHLLPSAAHTAEALDASLSAQAAGRSPLVGISHDVMARYTPVVDGNRRLMEATAIVAVNSADVVADPAAGGRATRMVAGGFGTLDSPPTHRKESQMTLKELLALLRGATAEKRAELLTEHAAVLEEFGLDAKAIDRLLDEPKTTPPTETETAPAESETVGAATEATIDRNGPLGRVVITAALASFGLDEKLTESFTKMLPKKFTEAQLTTQAEAFSQMTRAMESAGLRPTVPVVEVTRDAMDKKAVRLGESFGIDGDGKLLPGVRSQGDFQHGYHSLKEAFLDITGMSPRVALDSQEFAEIVARESLQPGGVPVGEFTRRVESVVAATWSTILGDSITRRMVAEYQQPNLQSMMRIVSSTPPVNDFRTQRIERLGGYGTLPAVAQGAPYQPLTSPTNEEVTYSVSKRGGTEDLTLETIANDDLRAVTRIPIKLGLAAAQTLFRFVWDFVNSNANIYDSSALFVAGHNNLATAALSNTALAAARKAMRKQAAYGDTSDILSIVPRFLVVPPDLEELAFELTTSAVAIPTSAPDGGASNIPNLHNQMEMIVVDYFSATSATEWFTVADPTTVPTIEIGFYQGQRDPSLFVQNDPTVGSVFTSDKITYKIRHIYSGAVLDFRGFYRGNT